MTLAVSTVKKIRRFRLHPRPSAVHRHLKSLLEDASLTPELEKKVEAEMAVSQAFLETAALFDTLTFAQAPAWSAPLWQPSEGKKPVAFTFYVATLGMSFEGLLAEALCQGEGLRSRVLTALGEELADQAAHFVERLVSEEARQDSCELEEARVFSDSRDIQAVLGQLEAGRLAISYDGAGHLSPRFTRVGAIPWGPPAKKKK